MDKNFIASELVQAAKSLVSRGDDLTDAANEEKAKELAKKTRGAFVSIDMPTPPERAVA